jgi:hypothetical protein
MDMQLTNNLSPTKCHKQAPIRMGTLVQPEQSETSSSNRRQMN